NKARRGKQLGFLSQIGPATEPLQVVSIDTVGGFSGYNSVKKYAHIAIDHCTRFVWIVCSKTQTGKDFINLAKIIMQQAKPKMILADKYTGINSHEFSHFLEKQKIKLMFISTNCPQSNGICERVNQTLVNRLRCKFNENVNKNISWHKLMHECVNEYNNTLHSVTKYTPNFLLNGIQPFNSAIEDKQSQQEALVIANRNSQRNHESNKQRYDANHENIEFKEGDLVWIEHKNDISRRKLDQLMTGPFEVVKRISPTTYEIKCYKKGKKTDLFHISKLRQFTGGEEA
ncbi:uncharacterized protein B4U80_06639, partial [Leptotrombidium deliense]